MDHAEGVQSWNPSESLTPTLLDRRMLMRRDNSLTSGRHLDSMLPNVDRTQYQMPQEQVGQQNTSDSPNAYGYHSQSTQFHHIANSNIGAAPDYESCARTVGGAMAGDVNQTNNSNSSALSNTLQNPATSNDAGYVQEADARQTPTHQRYDHEPLLSLLPQGLMASAQMRRFSNESRRRFSNESRRRFSNESRRRFSSDFSVGGGTSTFNASCSDVAIQPVTEIPNGIGFAEASIAKMEEILEDSTIEPVPYQPVRSQNDFGNIYSSPGDQQLHPWSKPWSGEADFSTQVQQDMVNMDLAHMYAPREPADADLFSNMCSGQQMVAENKGNVTSQCYHQPVTSCMTQVTNFIGRDSRGASLFSDRVFYLDRAMDQTFKSQRQLQEWDTQHGLRKCHSKTMRESSLSRKKIQELTMQAVIKSQCGLSPNIPNAKQA